jgi:hypothetical protein
MKLSNDTGESLKESILENPHSDGCTDTKVERFRVQRSGLINPQTAHIKGILSSFVLTREIRSYYEHAE